MFNIATGAVEKRVLATPDAHRHQIAKVTKQLTSHLPGINALKNSRVDQVERLRRIFIRHRRGNLSDPPHVGGPKQLMDFVDCNFFSAERKQLFQ